MATRLAKDAGSNPAPGATVRKSLREVQCGFPVSDVFREEEDD